MKREDANSTIAALAGRRPDALDTTTPRFPLAQVPAVRERLRRALAEVTTLVCAAACGADLLALEVAANLGIDAHVVLPFAPDVFRRLSVTDRPGNWGPLFDQLLEQAQDRQRLHLLSLNPDDPHAFEATNRAIVMLVRQLAGAQPTIGISVWEGQSRGPRDATAHFRALCHQDGFQLVEISTN